MTTDSKTHDLTMTRIYAAPPERVFDAWLSKDWGKWAGPRGVHGEVTLMEPHVGGRYRMVMHAPDGQTFIVSGVYREIDRPRRLVKSWKWDHEDHATQITLTLRAVEQGTELTMLHEGIGSAEAHDDHATGWAGTLERLGEFLAAE